MMKVPSTGYYLFNFIFLNKQFNVRSRRQNALVPLEKLRQTNLKVN